MSLRQFYKRKLFLVKKSEMSKKTFQSNFLYHKIYTTSSFIQTLTVGFGITPNLLALAGFTAGRDLHPALKILFNLSYTLNLSYYENLVNDFQPFLRDKKLVYS